MPDGSKRARRNGEKGEPRRKWYAKHREIRFNARYGLNTPQKKDN